MSIHMKRSWRKEMELDDENITEKAGIRSNNSSRDSSSSSNNRKKTKPNPEYKTRNGPHHTRVLENDPSVLQRRQKQIDYGKNTVGYHNYIKSVPFDRRSKQDPKTPDKYTKYSRRSWDMMIKLWRKELHCYDQSSKEFKGDLEDGSIDSGSVKSESLKDDDEYDNIEVIVDESDIDKLDST